MVEARLMLAGKPIAADRPTEPVQARLMERVQAMEPAQAKTEAVKDMPRVRIRAEPQVTKAVMVLGLGTPGAIAVETLGRIAAGTPAAIAAEWAIAVA